MTHPRTRALRSLFTQQRDPYAGADLATSRRIVGLLWALSLILTLALLPLSPPTEAIGAAGWIVTAGILAGGALGAARILDPRRPATFDHLLLVSYLGLAQTALLVWLAGEGSGYRELFLLWVGSGVGVHPPKRGIPFLATALLASALPLALDGWSGDAATDVAAHALLWCAVGLALVVLVAATRSQRTELRTGEQAARAEAEAAATHVRTLHAIAEIALEHKPLDALLDELLDLVGRALNVEWRAVLLHDEGRLTLRAVSGQATAEPGITIHTGDWLAGRVAKRRKPLITTDVNKAERDSPLLNGQHLCSLAAVPLLANGELIGVLQVGSLDQRRFSDDDVALLQLAGERMALAIDRGRLFEKTHHIAETLQRKLLPERLPSIPGVELAARYLPGGPGVEVGGDWYDVFSYKDGRVGLAMGDVVGRGIDAASLMGQLRTALRAYALEDPSPPKVLDRLGALFHQLAPGQMATLVFVVFDPRTSVVHLASAGHPPPLAIAPDGTTTYLRHDPCPPLGVMPYLAYNERVARLEPGSTVLLYTDGLVEQRGSIEVGLNRLREAAVVADPEQLCDRIVSELLPDGSVDDDAALLALRPIPLHADRLELDLPADAEALVHIRRSLREWLTASGASRTDAYAIAVACGEACANAIEHAYPPGDAAFRLEAQRTNGDVEVVVADNGRWRRRVSAERGRGIDLMKSLSDELEITSTESGTSVRMRRHLTGASG